MSARQDPTRREDLLFMLLHGGAASNSIASHVVDLAIGEALDQQKDELSALRARVAELETRSTRVRTDELVLGDRVWHPHEMERFTVARVAPDGSAARLVFHNRATDENESGVRVTGTDDSGETVHVDCAPSYLWHREDAASEVARLRARIAELEAERKKYVGVEPTVAEELAYVNRCLNAVYAVCDAAEKQATRWEHSLPVPEWVALIRNAADGVTLYAPALPPVPQQRQVEDPHDSVLHHDYALGRDLPVIPHQTTGRCPRCSGTFEDCTCGGAA